VAVCGGLVIVRPPAGADWGILVLLEEADELDEADTARGLTVGNDGEGIVLRARRRRRRRRGRRTSEKFQRERCNVFGC